MGPPPPLQPHIVIGPTGVVVYALQPAPAPAPPPAPPPPTTEPEPELEPEPEPELEPESEPTGPGAADLLLRYKLNLGTAASLLRAAAAAAAAQPEPAPPPKPKMLSRRSQLIHLDHRLSVERKRRERQHSNQKKGSERAVAKQMALMAPPPWFKGSEQEYQLDSSVKMRKETLERLSHGPPSRQQPSPAAGVPPRKHAGGQAPHRGPVRQWRRRRPRTSVSNAGSALAANGNGARGVAGGKRRQGGGRVGPEQSWEATMEKHRALETAMTQMEAMVAAQSERRAELRGAVRALAAQNTPPSKPKPDRPPSDRSPRRQEHRARAAGEVPDFVKRLVPAATQRAVRPQSARPSGPSWKPGGIHPPRRNISRTHFVHGAAPAEHPLPRPKPAPHDRPSPAKPEPDLHLAEQLAFLDAAEARREEEEAALLATAESDVSLDAEDDYAAEEQQQQQQQQVKQDRFVAARGALSGLEATAARMNASEEGSDVSLDDDDEYSDDEEEAGGRINEAGEFEFVSEHRRLHHVSSFGSWACRLNCLVVPGLDSNL